MKIGLTFERVYPYLLGGSIGLAVWYYGAIPSETRFDSMVTAAISVAAILLGFLGTAKAMLLTFRSSKYSWIKSKPAVWSVLIGYFRSALSSSFFACLLSLVLLGVSITNLPAIVQPYVAPIWIGVFVVSVSAFYRVVAVFFTLLQSE